MASNGIQVGVLRSIVLIVFTAAALAPAGAQTPDKAKHMIEGVRNVRYCEIIPVVRTAFTSSPPSTTRSASTIARRRSGTRSPKRR